MTNSREMTGRFVKSDNIHQTKEKSIPELLCEPSLEIEVYENTAFDEFHEFVYKQIDLAALISAFNAVLLKPEWLRDKQEGYLPVTSRKYSVRYLKGVEIKDIRHGSLLLTIVGGVASGLILMLIQETYKKMHPDQSSSLQIDVNYDHCSFIVLNGDQINTLPKESVTRNALRINPKTRLNELDARAFIEGILTKVDINNDMEGNILRLIEVLSEEKIIAVSPVYNSKGVRTVTNCAGRLIDYQI